MKKKVLIFYTVDRTNLHLLSFDVNNLYKTKPISIDMNTRRWKHHLEGISVSNEGFIFIVQDLSNIRKNKDKISVNCHRIAPDGLIVESLFQPENVYSEDVHYTYDNLHKKLVLAGTYKNKNNDWANGFWMLDVDNDLNEGQLNSYPFDDETLSEINGNSKQAFKGIKDLYIVELVQRKDGGTLILSEIQKEYSRRPDINPRLSETSFGVRRWIDYYYEDIILMSIHPSREQHWSTVMHKRQYSQDDEAVYSSFFLMKNPAMLKFIFNDEIRNSNTISEYVVTSRGLLERNSLMNTANLKLQLRLIDATQVGPNTILIPSQSNHQLNIVKMVF